ncbi:MAG: hypothetical protein JWN62_4033 [Acidimicrobiales bacterium]|jgi:hypothetical protein|nr:hypothetical protein [Acidimicrobiales bacterium]
MPPPPGNLAPPPGYVLYGGANQGAYGAFQRTGGLSKWLGIALMVLIPVQALALLKSASDRSKARDFISGKISEDDYTRSVALSGVLGLLSFAVFAAVAVLTIIWMYRMAKNSQTMRRIGTWTPGWAIGGWFVPPIVLYVVPFLMLRDLWKASDPDSAADWRTNRVAPIVNVWWVLYGLAPILFIGVTFSSFQLDRSAIAAAKEIDSKFGITLASSMVQIAAAAAYLVLVRQLSARHKRVTNEA